MAYTAVNRMEAVNGLMLGTLKPAYCIVRAFQRGDGRFQAGPPDAAEIGHRALGIGVMLTALYFADAEFDTELLGYGLLTLFVSGVVEGLLIANRKGRKG